MRRHIDPDKLSSDQPDNDQNVEQIEANGRNHKQIHSCDVRRMVTQEGAPTLTGRVGPPGHVLGDGRLRDRKAELEQLTMNARAPQADFQRSSAGSMPANLPRSAAGLPGFEICIASSGETQRDASAPGFPAELSSWP